MLKFFAALLIAIIVCADATAALFPRAAARREARREVKHGTVATVSSTVSTTSSFQAKTFSSVSPTVVTGGCATGNCPLKK